MGKYIGSYELDLLGMNVLDFVICFKVCFLCKACKQGTVMEWFKCNVLIKRNGLKLYNV